MATYTTKSGRQFSIGSIVWGVLKYVILIFFSLAAVIPIISCVITSFKTETEYQSTNVMTLPKSFLNFSNLSLIHI